jgi:hypothetical protein
VNQGFSVAKAAQSISFAALANRTLGAAPFTISATASSGLAISFASLTSAVCTISGATVTLVSAGTCTIQASQPGNANYAAAPNVSQGFTVSNAQQSQTISFGALANQAYGTAPFALSATASSGLAVNFASLTLPVCTVSASTVTLVAVGTCTIQASQAGNAAYLAAPNVSQSFTVAQAAQTISFAALASKTLGTPPFTVSATASSGLPVGFASLTAAVCTVSASTVTLVSAGTCTIQASQPGNANYAAAPSVAQNFAVTIVLQSQTITFAALGNQVFATAPFAVSATASSGLPVSFASLTTSICTTSGSTVTLLGVGTCTIQASQAGNATYAAAPNVSQSFGVTQAAQNISFAALGSQILGAAPFTVSATASSGLTVGFASLTTAVCTVSGATVTLLSAGTCTIQATQSGNANYAAAPSVSQSFAVTIVLQNQTITFGGLAGRTFGTAPFTVSATASSGLAVSFASLTSAVCTVSGATVTLLTVGTCTIQASQAGNATYAPAPNVSQSFAVAQAAQTISFAALGNQAFGTAPFTVSATASSGLPVAFASTTPGVCTIGGSTVSLVSAGTCTIQASQTGNANYAAAPNVSQSFTVTQAAQTINFAALGSQVLGAAPFTVSATASSGLAVSFASLTAPVCTVSGSTVTLVSAGTCTVQASQPGNANYAAAASVSQGFAVTIVLQNQTISFAALGNQAFGAAPFAVSATASSGLTVSFASLTAPVCTVSGSTVTVSSVGTCTLQASQAGNATYAAATNVSQSFAVTQAAQTISFAALGGQILGAAPFTVSATASSGLPVGFASLTSSVCTMNAATVTLLSAGTCTIQASQSGNANYAAAPVINQGFAVTIVLQNQTISFSALSNQLFATAPFSVSATASSGLVVGFASLTTAVCTVSGSTVTLVSVGTCTIQAAQPGNATYAPAPNASQSFAVTQAAQTISFAALGSQTLGTAPFTVSATATSGLAVGFASLTSAVCTVSGATVTLVSVGTCSVQASQPGNANYAAAPVVSQSFAVTSTLQSQTINFAALSNQAFGSAPLVVSATATSGLPITFISLTTAICAVSGSTVTLTSVGVCMIQASQAGNATYAAAPPVSQSFTVTQGPQSISFSALGSHALGSGPFTVTAAASSGLAVAFASLTTATCTVSGSTVTLVTAGACTIQASQAGNANYAPALNVNQSFAITTGLLSQTITFGPISDRPYLSPSFAIGASASSGLPVSFATQTPSICLVTASTVVSISSAGVCRIRASQAGDGTYAAAPVVDQAFTVTPATQTISFGALSNQILGASPFTIAASASSLLSVTFTTLTATVCTVSGGQVTLLSIGTCTIRASQSGGTNYAAAPSISQSFTVGPHSLGVTFAAVASYATDNFPSSMVSADFNGDGIPDLAVANAFGPSISIFIGHADGTFTAGTTLMPGGTPVALAVGDVNGDGKADLVVSDQSTALVTVFLGNGNGTFTRGASVSAGAFPGALALADVNGDGKLDLMVVNTGSAAATVTVLLGNGNGTFGSPAAYATETSPDAVVVADFNGDGKPDMAVANFGSGTVSVLFGNGDGTFAAPVNYGAGNGPDGLAVGDFNGDGKPDLAVVNDHSNDVSVFLNNGDGTFAPAVSYTTGSGSANVAVVDINGDGRLDLVVNNRFDNTLALLFGNGNGTFAAPLTYPIGGQSSALVVRDLNGDGRPDVIVTSNANNNVSVLLQTAIVAATLVVQSGSPQSANIGAPYASPLAVLARDAGGNPLAGVVVTFTAPASGPSGRFSGGFASIQSASDASGIAIAPAFTAGLTAGSFSVVARAGSSSATFALTNVGALASPSFTSNPPPSGNVSIPYSFSVTASGAPAPTFSVLANSLPTGLSLNGSTGSIGGTPSAQGTFAGLLTATNGVPPDATQAFAITIAGTAQTITFNALANQTLGASPFALSATASSGLTVSFATLTSAVCTVSGSTVTLVAAGTCTIRASQAGNATYSAAPNVDQSFTVTNASGALFVPPVQYATGTFPSFVVTGDFNGDGKLDVAVVNESSATVSIFLGNGDGTLRAGTTLVNTGSFPSHAALADLNGDGYLDLVVSSIIANQVVVYLGNGDGTFRAPTAVPVGLAPFGVVVADFNGDGKPDIAVVNGSSGSIVGQTVSVLLGNGNGTFQSPVAYTVGTGPVDLAVGDFNGDGRLDLAVTNASSNTASILLGNGDGTFGPAVSFATGFRPTAIQVGDLDGDGTLDLAIATSLGYSILLGHGDGTFGAATNGTSASGPQAVALGDFNVDGKLDAAIANSLSNNVSVHLGNGAGGLQAPTFLAAGSGPIAVAPGSLRGNGNLDLIVANDGSSTVSVYLNTSSARTPATVSAKAGTPQSAVIQSLFATPMSVWVRDSAGRPLAGIQVTFSAPTSGATGSFGNAQAVARALSDATGAATAPAFFANLTPGSYAVVASVGSLSASFSLTNLGGTQSPTFTSSPPPAGQVLIAYSYQLTANGNPSPTFAVTGGALPTGLSLVGNGLISGTPTVAGQFTGVLTATNTVNPPAAQAFSIVIAKGAQTISFTQPFNVQFGNPGSFTLTASATSGLQVTFTSLSPAVCSVSGNVVAEIDLGTCTIRASQAGNENYAPAADVDRSFNISQTQFIQFSALGNKTYTDPPFTISATATSHLPVGFSSLTASVCTVSGNTVSLAAAGTCTIQASQAGNASYYPAPTVDQSFIVHQSLLGQTITFATLSDQPFAASPFNISATSSAGLPVTFASLTTTVCQVFGNTVTVITVGACSIRASQGGNADYSAAPDVDRSFSVVLAGQTITIGRFDEPFLNTQPLELFGVASSKLAVSYASLTPNVCGIYGNRVTLLIAGACTIRLSQGGNANYLAAPNLDVSFNIKPAFQTMVFPQPDAQTLVVPQLVLLTAVSSGLPVTFSTPTAAVCTTSGNTVTLIAAGTCTVVATQAGDANYAPASISRDFDVSPGTLVIPTTVIPGPSVAYYTALAGNPLTGLGADKVFDVVAGADGSAWVGGSAAGTYFPELSSATFSNSGLDLLFLAKMNAARGKVDVATAVGARSATMTGTGQNAYVGADQVEAMAMDATGAVYVAAYASSARFPVTGGTYARTGAKTIYRVGNDGTPQPLTAVIDPAVKTIRALAVDGAGGIYIAGTAGPGMITSANAAVPMSSAPAGGPVLIKLVPGGSAIAYSTYLSVAGSRPSVTPDPSRATIDTATTPYAVAVDAAGNAFVAGQARANDFPVTAGAPDTFDAASRDAFVAKINAAGTALVWVARLGDTDADRATSIALSPDGTVVIGGKTASYPLIGSSGVFQGVVTFLPNTASVDRETGFVAKIAADGSRWLFVLPVGSADGNLIGHEDLVIAAPCCDIVPIKVAVDATGAIYATGRTRANRRLPVAGPEDIYGVFAAIQSPYYDPGAPTFSTGAFLMKFSADAVFLSYSVIIGDGTPTGLAVDSNGAVYVAGYGAQPRSPFANTGQAAPGSAFVAKILSQSAPLVLSTSPNPASAASSVTLNASVADARYGGSVEFFDGAQSLGTAPVSAGAATMARTFAVGIHRLSAVFHGSGPLDGSPAAEVILVVNQ